MIPIRHTALAKYYTRPKTLHGPDLLRKNIWPPSFPSHYEQIWPNWLSANLLHTGFDSTWSTRFPYLGISSRDVFFDDVDVDPAAVEPDAFSAFLASQLFQV